MYVTEIIREDYDHYKECSLYVATTKCSFKCDREYGEPICQEYTKQGRRGIYYTPKQIFNMYNTGRAKAIVFGGLEPFDSAMDLCLCIKEIREHTSKAPIIIYSGYTPEELDRLRLLAPLVGIPNIIIKTGRYIPGDKPHFDAVLGVKLASRNQRAQRLPALLKQLSCLRRDFVLKSVNGKRIGRPRKEDNYD